MQALKERYGFDTVRARSDLVRLVGDIPGSHVLDVGTGSGWMAMILAERGFNVVTVDIDRGVLDRARQRLKAVGSDVAARVDFIHADALRLPLAAATFDAVFSFDSIHHMPDCRAALEEMVRVCRPSGVLAIADLNSRGLLAVRAENAERGESHYENPCRVDAIAAILDGLQLEFRQYDSGFVSNFVVRVPPLKRDDREVTATRPDRQAEVEIHNIAETQMPDSYDMTIEVFTPPMCCVSGMCGPDLYEELMRFNQALTHLERRVGNVIAVHRVVPNKEPHKFMENKTVVSAMKEGRGSSELPITIINGQIIKQGSYPSLRELTEACERTS